MTLYFSFWIPSIWYWISLSYFEEVILPPLKKALSDDVVTREENDYIICTFNLKDYSLKCYFFKCGICTFEIINIKNDIDIEENGFSIAKNMLNLIKETIHHVDISEIEFPPIIIKKEKPDEIVKKFADEIFKQLMDHYTIFVSEATKQSLSDLKNLAKENTIKIKYFFLANELIGRLYKNERRALDILKACNYIRLSASSSVCDDCSVCSADKNKEKFFKSLINRINNVESMNQTIIKDTATIRELTNYVLNVFTVTVATILAVIIPLLYGITMISELFGPQKYIFLLVSSLFIAFISYYSIFNSLKNNFKKFLG